MSYSALGETASWWGCSSSTSEVYLWQANALGAKLSSPADALLIAKAIGKNNPFGADVRGVLVFGAVEVGFWIDVVMTVSDGTLVYPWCYPPLVKTNMNEDLAGVVANDAEVRARFPNIVIPGSWLLKIAGPAQAVDFWKAHHLLVEKGKPTAKFGEVDGAYFGKADEAPNVKPWRLHERPLGPGGELDKGSTSSGGPMTGAIIAGAAIGVAYLFEGKVGGLK